MSEKQKTNFGISIATSINNSTDNNMKNNFKNIIYPLLILMIAASCSAPRYASAQNDGYYNDNNNNQNYPNQDNNNYSYNQNQGNYNNQEYDDPNNYDENPADVNINTFNDALNPYGRWIESPEYGRCWIAGIQGFVPYSTGGHWLYSSYGWTWASDYNWGWAPFHYGRWAYDPFYGWMWVPGYEWGPAWVAWRTGGGFYGWSPLGPGISIGIGFGNGIPYNRWVFAPCQYMGYSHINRYYAAPSRNVTILNNTTVINNTTVYNNHTFVAGPNRSDVERVTGRRINAVQIQNASAPGRTVISQNRVQMYRPGVTPRFQNGAQNANGNRNTQLLRQRNNDVNNQNQDQINRTNSKPFVTDGRNQTFNDHQNNPQVNQTTQPVPDERYRLDNNSNQQMQDNNRFNQHQQQQNQQLQQQQRQQQYQQMQQQQNQQRQQQMQQMQQRQQQFEQQRQQQMRQQQNTRPPEMKQFNNSFNNRSQGFSQPRQQSFSQPHFSGGGGRSGKHGF